jgi:hypothetical protein
MSKLCSMRKTDCPLGCGQEMRHKMLKDHMEADCPRRHHQQSATYGTEGSGKASK